MARPTNSRISTRGEVTWAGIARWTAQCGGAGGTLRLSRSWTTTPALHPDQLLVAEPG